MINSKIQSESYLFEVHQHIDQHHIRAITLHQTRGLYRGMSVYDSGLPSARMNGLLVFADSSRAMVFDLCQEKIQKSDY